MRRKIAFSLTIILLGLGFTNLLVNYPVLMEDVEAASCGYRGGDGSAGNPYNIMDVWDLQNMSSDPDAHYVLSKDIDASITRSWNGGSGFSPVGNGSAYFNGTFEGCGFMISNLTVNRSSENNAGLFGILGKGSRISNVSLEDVNITGNLYVGGLVGFNWGTIENSRVTGSFKGYLDIGALAGDNYGGIIQNCHTDANASGAYYVGAFSGRNSGTIEKCYSRGEVHGDSGTGGFIGVNYGQISKCFSTSDASSRQLVGGFVGDAETGSITDCFSTGHTNGTYSVGGFNGGNFGCVLINCYSTGNVSGSVQVGGFIGTLLWDEIYDCFWDNQTSGQLTNKDEAPGFITGLNTTDMIRKTTFDPEWDFNSVWGIVEGGSYPFFLWDEPMIETQDLPGWNVSTEDVLYSFDFHAKLPYLPGSANRLTWSIRMDRNEWLFIDPDTGVISGIPSNADWGEHRVSIKAADIGARENVYNFTLTVINSPPIITNSDINMAASGSIYLNDYDSTDDGQGEITWVMVSNASWLNPIYLDTGLLLGYPRNLDIGTYWVNVSVDDGNGGTDFTNFTIEVKMDSDEDGTPDETDTDDDNDGFPDVEDDFPIDPTEWLDTDGDGIGNNKDQDDDDDGWVDDLEKILGSDPLDEMSVPPDMDGDGIADLLDDDTDGDGYINSVDAFPENSSEWYDSDRDGIGDNSDDYPFDMDNDGYNDTVDGFPMDPMKWDTPMINNTVYKNQTVVEYNNRTIYKNRTLSPSIEDIYLNDSDGDGMPDAWELLYGLNPDNPSDSSLDPDDDGISNLEEYNEGTSPNTSNIETPDDGSDTPPWAWMAMLAAVILGVAAAFFAIRSRRNEHPGRSQDNSILDHEE